MQTTDRFEFVDSAARVVKLLPLEEQSDAAYNLSFHYLSERNASLEDVESEVGSLVDEVMEVMLKITN